MSTLESEFPAVFEATEFKTSFGSRSLSATKVFFVVALVSWLTLMTVMKHGVGRRMRPPNQAALAALLTLGIAGLFAWRRFANHTHTLRIGQDSIDLASGTRRIRLNPQSVQGVIGAGGMQPVLQEMLVWNRTIIVDDGKAYTLLLSKEQNPACYYLLREVCPHAWGLPFGGKLETPVAGPELSPEEYVESLSNVRRHYFLLTQKTLFTGIVIALGSIAVLLAIIINVGFAGRSFKGLIWLGILSLFGFVTIYRALAQMGVLWKILSVERRLHEAM